MTMLNMVFTLVYMAESHKKYVLVKRVKLDLVILKKSSIFLENHIPP